MIILSTYNTEKIYGIEIKVKYEEKWSGWFMWKKYKTAKGVIDALRDYKRVYRSGKYKFRIVHVYYEFTQTPKQTLPRSG